MRDSRAATSARSAFCSTEALIAFSSGMTISVRISLTVNCPVPSGMLVRHRLSWLCRPHWGSLWKDGPARTGRNRPPHLCLLHVAPQHTGAYRLMRLLDAGEQTVAQI